MSGDTLSSLPGGKQELVVLCWAQIPLGISWEGPVAGVSGAPIPNTGEILGGGGGGRSVVPIPNFGKTFGGI